MDSDLNNLISEIDNFKIKLVTDDRNVYKKNKINIKEDIDEKKCKDNNFNRDFKKRNIPVDSVLNNSFGISRSRDNTYGRANVMRDNYVINKPPMITNRNFNTFDKSYEEEEYNKVNNNNKVIQSNQVGHQQYYLQQNQFQNKELLYPNINIQKPLNQFIKEHTLVIDSVDRDATVYPDLFSLKVSFNGNTKPYFSDILKRTRYLRLDKLILPNTYKINKVDTPYQTFDNTTATDITDLKRQYTVTDGNILENHEFAIQLDALPNTYSIKVGDKVKLTLDNADNGDDISASREYTSYITNIVGKTIFLPIKVIGDETSDIDGSADIALNNFNTNSSLEFYNLDECGLDYPNPFLVPPTANGTNTITNEIIGKYRITYQYSATEYSFQSLETGNYYYRNGSEYYYPDPSYEIGADRYIHMSIEEIDENNDYATNSVSMRSFGLLYPASVSRGYAYIATSYSDVSYSMSNLKDLTSLTFKFYDSVGKQITCSDNLDTGVTTVPSDDITEPYHPSHYVRHPLFIPRQLHMVFKAGQVVVEQERSDII